MLLRTLLLVLFTTAFAHTTLMAERIAIGIYYGFRFESFVFSAVEGEYIMEGNGSKVAVVVTGSMLHIDLTQAGFAVRDTDQSYGVFSSLEFRGMSISNIFQVRPVFPSNKPKESTGDLEVTQVDDCIRLINTLDLDEYIAGTVESEGGSNALPEFYKAQAVIARTFAIKNFHRHAHEGFNLCDNVHCQAYKGKSRMNRQIYEAVQKTRNEILANNAGEPVITAYHANCGGITGSAAVEWNRDLPYLVPVQDPFCDRSAHRNWDKVLTENEWKAYLNKKAPDGCDAVFSDGDTTRRKYLDLVSKKIPMTTVREDLGLKSSFFRTEYNNGHVIIHGHGYGHGLGLCQEGAMEMARMGYTYVDILMFYFNNLILKKE
ncbi:MAG: SpoIID/LytB domain-containing protein [Bacteroidales bacterium]|nr:SpoIID/LytB domain-containing protein [Bacteroidales bacterium]